MACRYLRDGGRTDALERLGCRRPRQGPKCVSTSRERNVCGEWNVEHSSIVSSRYVGSMFPKNSSQGSMVRRARIASANLTCSTAAQSMQWPVIKGRTRSIWKSSSWGPRGNYRRG
ncbi:hypothetical protein GOBAR_AA27183 [Gossypium barbadense]|uniref:Uncharacterized protein n=1 Tax=Gossypium barbadense TaxID=3634 RepID=A0A2P5WR20_GOSBA|nr:hypothetical protein GOBAR_AA27183 [Gossypium barbadense]